MGYAIESLGDGVRNVLGNPTIVALTFGLVVVLAPLAAVIGVLALVLSFVPVVGQALGQLLFAVTVKPLLLGGVLGMVGSGFAGSVGLGDLLEGITENFPSLAGGFALFELVRYAVGLVLGIVAFVLVFAGSLGSAAVDSSGTATAGVGALVLVLAALAVAVVVALYVVFQFVDVAIVLGEEGAVSGLVESYRLFRSAPLSVLGYSVLRVLLAVAIVLPGYVLAFLGAEYGELLTYAGVALLVLLTPVALAASLSYHAAYYGHRIRARSTTRR